MGQRKKENDVLTLSNEILLKLGQELQIKQVLRGQSLLTDDSLHGLDIFTDGIAGVLVDKQVITEHIIQLSHLINTQQT